MLSKRGGHPTKWRSLAEALLAAGRVQVSAEITALDAGQLRITGRSAALVTQARGLTDALSALAAVSSFTVEQIDPAPRVTDDEPVVVSPAQPADLGGSQLSLWLGDELLEVVPVPDQGRFDVERTIEGRNAGVQQTRDTEEAAQLLPSAQSKQTRVRTAQRDRHS